LSLCFSVLVLQIYTFSLEYIAELFFFVDGLHLEMMNLAESLLVSKKNIA